MSKKAVKKAPQRAFQRKLLPRQGTVQAKRTRKPISGALRRGIVVGADIPKMDLETKRINAFELLLEGHSQYDIGVALGVTQARISQILKDVLEEKSAQVEEMLPHVRAMELERINRMIVAWYKAAKKDPRASDTLLRWIERRHKILPGMEITRNEMGGIGGGPIRLSASAIDITKLNERQLANLEEIMRVAGPKVQLPEDEFEMPALEHDPPKKKQKEEEEG
jgi:hypothetical protein